MTTPKNVHDIERTCQADQQHDRKIFIGEFEGWRLYTSTDPNTIFVLIPTLASKSTLVLPGDLPANNCTHK